MTAPQPAGWQANPPVMRPGPPQQVPQWSPQVPVRPPTAPKPPKGRKLNLVALIGLATSLVTLIVTLPQLTEAGGAGLFFGDVFAHAWPLALITLAAGPVRTLNWQVFVGIGFTGFFGIFAGSAFVGRLVLDRLGAESGIARTVLIPLVEEILKLLPALLIAVLALRRAEGRPSAMDIVLLGAWTGAGFGLHENAAYGRGGADFASAPPLSLLFPTAGWNEAGGTSVLASGHLVYTGLIALGIGICVLYRRRWRLAWIALPAAFAVAFGEHAVVNAVAVSGGDVPVGVQIAHGLLLGGWLSSLLLIGGTAFVVLTEWRNATRRRIGPPEHLRPRTSVPSFLWLAPLESGWRSRLLVRLQRTPARRRTATPPVHRAQQQGARP